MRHLTVLARLRRLAPRDMAKLCLLPGALALTACGHDPQAAQAPSDPPPFRSIDFPATGSRYTRYEVSVDLATTYADPFDRDQVALAAVFTDPSGAALEVPAFYFEDFARSAGSGAETTLTPRGIHGFKVRFAPTQPGDWSFHLVLRQANMSPVNSLPREFSVANSTRHGFVRQAPLDANSFVFDDGTPFFGVGENLVASDVAVYERALARLGATKATLARVRLRADLGLDLEWEAGLGRYDMRAAYVLDAIFAAAEQQGVAVMLSLLDSRAFSLVGDGQYVNNPYSVARGGPLPSDDPSAVWSNSAADASLRRLFDYLIARYGYSTALHSWELWHALDGVGANENELVTHFSAATDWHHTMAEFFRTRDPYKHLLTTSLAAAQQYDPAIFTAVDYAEALLSLPLQPDNDLSMVATQALDQLKAKLHRPLVIGQVALELPASLLLFEPQKAEAARRAGNEVAWAALLASAPSSALGMPEGSSEPAAGAVAVSGLGAFVAGEQLAALQGERRITQGDAGTSDVVQSISFVPGFHTLDTQAPATQFTVDELGLLNPDDSSLGAYLYNVSTTAFTSPTFHVTLRGPGRFDIVVGDASIIVGLLRVVVDGMAAKEVWVVGGTLVSVPLGAGAHSVTAESTGLGTIRIASYGMSAPQPLLRVRTLQSPKRIVGWIQNRLGTLTFARIGLVPGTLRGSSVTLTGVPSGDWSVEWWDLATGTSAPAVRQSASGGALVLTPPPFGFDAAFKASLP